MEIIDTLRSHQFELVLGLVALVALRLVWNWFFVPLGRGVKAKLKPRAYEIWKEKREFSLRSFDTAKVFYWCFLYAMYCAWALVMLYRAAAAVPEGHTVWSAMMSGVVGALIIIGSLLWLWLTWSLIKAWQVAFYQAWAEEADKEYWTREAVAFMKRWKEFNNRRCETLRKLENRTEEISGLRDALKHLKDELRKKCDKQPTSVGGGLDTSAIESYLSAISGSLSSMAAEMYSANQPDPDPIMQTDLSKATVDKSEQLKTNQLEAKTDEVVHRFNDILEYIKTLEVMLGKPGAPYGSSVMDRRPIAPLDPHRKAATPSVDVKASVDAHGSNKGWPTKRT